MQQRQTFDIALKELKLKLLRMGSDVQQALRTAIIALKDLNPELASQVVANDRNVNRLEHEIEDSCVRLIATQQPVASDLRRIIAGMRITSDLERMGDLAVDVAKSALRLQGQELVQSTAEIEHMAQIVDEMISTALNSYVDSNIELSRKLALMDDDVDHMYRKLVEQLFTQQYGGSSAHITQAMTMAFCGRYLERIGDHATNIGEGIIYIISGERSDLN